MMLHDRIDVVNKTDGTVIARNVPAQFGHGATSRDVQRGTVYTEGSRVILGPSVVFDPNVHAVRFRGEQWDADGQPMLRTRRGRPHHLTVPLTRSEVGV